MRMSNPCQEIVLTPPSGSMLHKETLLQRWQRLPMELGMLRFESFTIITRYMKVREVLLTAAYLFELPSDAAYGVNINFDNMGKDDTGPARMSLLARTDEAQMLLDRLAELELSVELSRG